jgi:hypothetical protein
MKVGIAIVSAWLGPHPDWLKAIIENHREYAGRHGYEYIFLNDEASDGFVPLQLEGFQDYSWVKVAAIRQALERREYAFWIDADSAFLDMSKTLDDLVEIGKDFVFTGDKNDLCNAGHLFFRKSTFTDRFLWKWETLQGIPFPPIQTTMQNSGGLVGDQVALNYLLAGGEADPKIVTMLGPSLFNKVNGWSGNNDRRHKRFGAHFSPTSNLRLVFSKILIARNLRPHVTAVPQHRLNAYPWWGQSIKGTRPGPIVHFVSGYKELIPEFRNFVKGR